jgi:amidase
MISLPEDTVGAFVGRPRVLVTPAASGPLDGRRLAVKDIIDVQGVVTGAGVPAFAADHEPAPANAACVQALVDAGATVVGKTLTDELAYSLAGRNGHFPPAVNVAAPGRAVGGSSTGSAAAVAAGSVELGLGTDTAGSIRVPASYCGIHGWRSSHGAVDTRGIVHLAPSMDTVGLLANDAATLHTAARVLLRTHGRVPERGDAPRAVLVAELLEAADPDVADVVERWVDGPVTALGLDPDAAAAAFVTLQGREAWAVHGAWIRRHPAALGADVAARFEAASAVSADDARAAEPVRDAVRVLLADATAGGDAVLLAPATPTAAPPTRPDGSSPETRRRLLALSTPASLAGCPVVVVPGPRDAAGRPVGVACIGAPGHDERLLAYVVARFGA